MRSQPPSFAGNSAPVWISRNRNSADLRARFGLRVRRASTNGAIRILLLASGVLSGAVASEIETGQDPAVVGKWPVRGLPTTFVVDPQGRLVYRAIGGREWDDEALLDLVRELKE